MKPLKRPDNRRAAVLIARFLRGKIRAREERELDRWINMDTDNLELFHRLTIRENREQTAKWLAANGVNPQFLKKPFESYKRPYDKKELRTFYVGICLGFLGLLLAYFVLRFL